MKERLLGFRLALRLLHSALLYFRPPAKHGAERGNSALQTLNKLAAVDQNVL